jgi:hypothetical protein
MKRALIAGVLSVAVYAGASAQTREWNFTVLLDGEPIGTHRFVLGDAEAGTRRLSSEAEFRVRLFGVPVYRYRHRAEEIWRGECLDSLGADTDDGGDQTRVQLRAGPADAFQLQGPQGTMQLYGCLASFAYWNPALRRQSRLLNVQTGRIEQVQWQRVESAEIDVQGRPLKATRWRLSGTERPLDVWWADDVQWVGLDAMVRGNRRLSYRLR